MEAEYNPVANEQVPITQAGWTVDSTGAEHSLTVRIIEERCEWHRRPCIKGYVDMGCFYECESQSTMRDRRGNGGPGHDSIYNKSAMRRYGEEQGRPDREIRDSIRQDGSGEAARWRHVPRQHARQ
eukprot:3381073-Pleurochrysis_carterae.AAC.1